ncbi:MAG: carbon-nitrogen hydrolase family protein [Clostridia bacterium]|nr:carbon-nitrogen hydrolase family protein [Clostridia bacterium]MBR6890136.1 carbon-nitrogen hydrolase family protein [Clostridia bacterium]
MKIRIMGVQPGTVVDGMTNSAYFDRQIELVRQRYDGEALVVFPELMTGIYFGYVREKRWFQYAEDFLTGPTTTAMLALCRELNCNICYSLFEKGDGAYYNTVGLVSPIRGVVGKYRKIHLPGGDLRYNECYEKYYFASGNQMPVLDLDNGVKLAMMTCYDRSFPEQWRSYYLRGAQIICVPACTMGLRKDMFVTELQTRALESHSYVIALNRAGEEKTENEAKPRVHFGKSLIIDPLGNIVAALEDEPWTTLSAEIDTDNIRYARARLNWERDRHPELYGIVSDTNYAREGLIYERGF